MKVTGISMVRNEADVIEAFVRHNLGVVDELIVIDHCSTDGTGELLHALADEGLPLSVGEERSLAHRQNVLLSGLMREAARTRGSDWVVPLDADEFLIAPDGDVRGMLQALPHDQARRIDLRFYVPCPDDPTDEANVLRRIRHRRIDEVASWTRKVIVPAAVARDSGRSLSQGSHELVDARTGTYLWPPFDDELALAHFPVRSASQLARKVLGGWPANVARPDRLPSGAFQWKRAFDAAVSGRLTPQRLQGVALGYAREKHSGRQGEELVFDPVPASFELRYAVPPGPAPLEVLAETAVRLADDLSAALREQSLR